MPTYAYECPAGHEFERFERKMSEPSRAKCPECGKMARRQISGGAGLLFKGSGFYITDYRKGPETKTEKGDETGPRGEKKEKEKEGKKKEKEKGTESKPSSGEAS